MTNFELFKEIFGIDETPKECVFFTAGEKKCHSCKSEDFWNKEVDLAKIGTNLVCEKELRKAILNSMFGTKYVDTDSSAVPDTGSYIVFKNDPWTEVPASLLADSIHTIGEILDDATVHGLDFKYENGKYYTKERRPNYYGFRPLDID